MHEGGYQQGYAQPGVAMVTDPEFYLVRFFDFTVEEGKRYRYRIQLAFKNPNFGVSPQHLKDPTLGDKSFNLGPWSEPSPVVAISNFNSLLVGPAKPASSIDDVHANMILVQYDREKGVKALYECRKKLSPKDEHVDDPVVRGRTLQFTRNVDVIDPLTLQPTTEQVEFLAKALVVDVKGGEPLAPANSRDRDREPGEIVLFDANGWLVIRSELDDASEYKRESELMDLVKNAKTQPATTVPGEGGQLPGAPDATRPIRRPSGN
jgi:hypothetical protein